MLNMRRAKKSAEGKADVNGLQRGIGETEGILNYPEVTTKRRLDIGRAKIENGR